MMMSFTLMMGCRISRYSVDETTPISTDSTRDVNTEDQTTFVVSTEAETLQPLTEEDNFLPYTGKSSFQRITVLGDMIFLRGVDFEVDCYIFDYDQKIFVETTDYECAQLGNRIIYCKDKDRAYGFAQGREDEFYISNKPTDTAFFIEESNNIHSLNLTDGKLTARLSDLDICKDTYAHYDFSDDTSRAIITMTPASDPESIQYRYWDTSTDDTYNLEDLTNLQLYDKGKSISTSLSFIDNNTLGILVSNSNDNKSALYSYDFNTKTTTSIKEFNSSYEDFMAAGNYYLITSFSSQTLSCIDAKTFEVLWEEKNLAPFSSPALFKEYNYVRIRADKESYESITWNFDTRTGTHEQVDYDYHNMSKIGVIVKRCPNVDGVVYHIVE